MLIEESVLVAYAMAVSRMLDARKLLTPGAPREVRERFEACEIEVGYLTVLHLMPSVPEMPPHLQ